MNPTPSNKHIKKGVKGFVPVPKELHKSKIIGFAVTEQEAKDIAATAAKLNVSKSTLIRMALADYKVYSDAK